MKRPKVVELDEERNAECPPATSADVGLSLEDCQPLLYRAETLLLGYVHSLFLNKRKQSSSMMTVKRQSQKVTRVSFDKERVKAAEESVGKVKDVIDVTPTASRTLRPEAYFAIQVQKIAVREYGFA